MKIKKITLTLITAFVAIQAATVVNLHFYDTVSISKKEILLSDVAEIKCPINTKNKLSKIVVGEAAPAGYSRFITSETTVLYDVLSKYSDISINRSGSTRTKVKTLGQISTLIEFESLVEEYISKYVKWKGTDWRVEILNGETKIRTLPGKYDVSVNGKVDSDEKGLLRLSLKIKQNDLTKNIPFTCRLFVSVPVVKASNLVTRGEVLKESDLYLEREDITSLRYKPLMDIQKAVGSVASRSISIGSVIHNLCVKQAPAVKKGDTVYIELASGKIRISVPARAREDGYKGETIWVENLKTHKILRVKIKDSGKVSLMEGELI